MTLNIHSIIHKSKANGPGLRTVVWFQGCSIRCPGCFNPLTHSFQPKRLIEPETLAEEVVSESRGIEGITISGGEPFDQPHGLYNFLLSIRKSSALSVILLSGYSFEEIKSVPHCEEVLQLVDVLIAGPFDIIHLHPRNLAGSPNKTYHFLTNRYAMSDFETIPDAEAIIDIHGQVTWSGIGLRVQSSKTGGIVID